MITLEGVLDLRGGMIISNVSKNPNNMSVVPFANVERELRVSTSDNHK